MGLFNKKDDVPKIPSAPTLPELPKMEQSEKKNLPELPSFPVTSKNENFNQEMVKSAVTDIPSSGENEAEGERLENIHITKEPERESLIPPRSSMENSISKLPEIPSITEVPKKTLEMTASTKVKPVLKHIEPIFVRIDRFQTAQKNFEQVKDKIREIESVLKKIKDIKSQEETELKGWTDDIEKIKSQLTEVDAGIFNQI